MTGSPSINPGDDFGEAAGLGEEDRERAGQRACDDEPEHREPNPRQQQPHVDPRRGGGRVGALRTPEVWSRLSGRMHAGQIGAVGTSSGKGVDGHGSCFPLM
jgi:hypothetical protein